ncbi:MAG: sigma-54-dependent Fis family transcriptional regulator, partial [Myxococcales bacterium]|nr:sigma-54-dependent Fis family transcriptional regulator [Myxococcales bacterium]
LEHFVEKLNARLGRSLRGISEEALGLLIAHPWRGNIRELENVVERCMLFCEGDRVEVEHLPPEVRNASGELLASSDGRAAGAIGGADAALGLKEAVKEATSRIERGLIVRALEQTGHNVTHAARLLKISRKSLQTKMKELGLRDE